MRTLLACGFVISLLAQGADPAAAQANDSSEAVVVTGHRIDEAVQAFVGSVSAEAGGEDQLARWGQRVCPGIIGLNQAQGQAIADRISLRALEIGLDIGEPGCSANVLVLVTQDSDRLAREILARHGALLARFTDPGVNTRGRAALDDFVNTPRAVRWWHVSRTTTADGFEANPDAPSGNLMDSAMHQSGGQSRINRTTRQDFSRAVIIVDSQRVGSAPIGVLADYIAMVALAQIEPDADTAAFPTILNLFSSGPGARPTALTDWDRAYLQGLYTAPANRSQASQERAVERAVRDEATATPH